MIYYNRQTNRPATISEIMTYENIDTVLQDIAIDNVMYLRELIKDYEDDIIDIDIDDILRLCDRYGILMRDIVIWCNVVKEV